MRNLEHNYERFGKCTLYYERFGTKYEKFGKDYCKNPLFLVPNSSYLGFYSKFLIELCQENRKVREQTRESF